LVLLTRLYKNARSVKHLKKKNSYASTGIQTSDVSDKLWKEIGFKKHKVCYRFAAFIP